MNVLPARHGTGDVHPAGPDLQFFDGHDAITTRRQDRAGHDFEAADRIAPAERGLTGGLNPFDAELPATPLPYGK